MIFGRITRDGEPVISVIIRGPGGEQHVESVIDTGFNGWLTLSPEQIVALGLPEIGEDQVILGDGSVCDVRTFEAVIVFGGEESRIPIEEAPTVPLVGTELLWGYGLRVDFQAAGRVEVEKLPA